ncbi:hypothetical protein [Cellulomonas carbonis]|uniref:Peptidase M23 n=1 Tax=Cellulomonas carbonis T26 TaxID=947969 RepID=A0A0A0BVY9_9CELL|nr:hypothetical protein [Cellulomonas carbonis]KGM11304.1 peptidase M23 [Cellulomonas carbonis T26]GGC00871.1 hypothetical protein GCM10010972_12090 [Cellulomonas carbonis]
MDGIAAITSRMAEIRSTLATLQPARASSSAATLALRPSSSGTATASGTASGPDFASALAAEIGTTTAAPAATSTGPLPAVPGLTPEQVGNARAVVAAGRAMGLSLRDAAIGVMTAMGESSLRVLDHGDTAGPDSRGLFQQRDNGAWGTLADRMDPTRSATSFFTALARVGDRGSMAPTLVAHTVQRNADPNHYTRYWEQAVDVVSRLTGATAAQVTAR